MLENDQIILRAVEPEDIDFLYSSENDTSVWRYGDTLVPFSRFAIKQYIANEQNDIYTNKQFRFVICLKPEREPIGTIDLFNFEPHHQRASVGILIHDCKNQHHGYAAQSLELLIEYCFTFLHLHQLHCTIAADNTHSIGLFTNAGFVQCGRLTDWLKTADGFIDMIEFQKINTSEKQS